jgi:hypothetical protein
MKWSVIAITITIRIMEIRIELQAEKKYDHLSHRSRSRRFPFTFGFGFRLERMGVNAGPYIGPSGTTQMNVGRVQEIGLVSRWVEPAVNGVLAICRSFEQVLSNPAPSIPGCRNTVSERRLTRALVGEAIVLNHSSVVSLGSRNKLWNSKKWSLHQTCCQLYVKDNLPVRCWRLLAPLQPAVQH